MITELYKSYLWSLLVSLIVLLRIFKNYDHQILQNRMSKITIILIIHDHILLSDWLLYQGPGSLSPPPALLTWAHPSPAWQSSGDSPRPPARSAAAGRRRGTARGGSGSPGLARPPGTTARGKGRGFHRETMRNHGEMAIDGENGGYWRMITTFSTCPMDFLGLTSGFRQQLSVKMGISQGQLVI